MRYQVTKDFIKIDETSGTLQNPSKIRTLEMNSTGNPNSGILISPLQKVSFQDTTIYVRCIDGLGEVRVVPFLVDVVEGVASGGGSSISYDHFTDEDIDDVLPHF